MSLNNNLSNQSIIYELRFYAEIVADSKTQKTQNVKTIDVGHHYKYNPLSLAW